MAPFVAPTRAAAPYLNLMKTIPSTPHTPYYSVYAEALTGRGWFDNYNRLLLLLVTGLLLLLDIDIVASPSPRYLYHSSPYQSSIVVSTTPLIRVWDPGIGTATSVGSNIRGSGSIRSSTAHARYATTTTTTTSNNTRCPTGQYSLPSVVPTTPKATREVTGFESTEAVRDVHWAVRLIESETFNSYYCLQSCNTCYCGHCSGQVIEYAYNFRRTKAIFIASILIEFEILNCESKYQFLTVTLLQSEHTSAKTLNPRVGSLSAV